MSDSNIIDKNDDNFTNLILGSRAEIQCLNSALTDLSIRWSNSSGSTVIVNNILVLPTVIPSHTGTQYTCTISINRNPLSCEIQSRTITVTVRG